MSRYSGVARNGPCHQVYFNLFFQLIFLQKLLWKLYIYKNYSYKPFCFLITVCWWEENICKQIEIPYLYKKICFQYPLLNYLSFKPFIPTSIITIWLGSLSEVQNLHCREVSTYIRLLQMFNFGQMSAIIFCTKIKKWVRQTQINSKISLNKEAATVCLVPFQIMYAHSIVP